MYKTIEVEVPDMESTDSNLGVKLEIYTDYNSPCPREWDELGTMISFHREIISDKNYTGMDVAHQLCSILNELGEEHYPYEEENVDLLNRIMKSEKLVVLPLYIYSHSGVRISTTFNQFAKIDPTGFDWGFNGIYFTTRQKIKKQYNVEEITEEILEMAKKNMRNNLKIFDEWANGEVYRYMIIDLNNGQVIDSCGGFIGDDWKKDMADSFENKAWIPLLDTLVVPE